MMYAICHSLKLIDAIAGPKNLITSRELLYNIRMKPWSSVGVPALPTYDQYVRALRKSTIAEDMIASQAGRKLPVRSPALTRLNKFCSNFVAKRKSPQITAWVLIAQNTTTT